MKLFYFKISRMETLERGCIIAEDAHDALNRIVAMMHDWEHLKSHIGKADIRVRECEKGYILI